MNHTCRFTGGTGSVGGWLLLTCVSLFADQANKYPCCWHCRRKPVHYPWPDLDHHPALSCKCFGDRNITSLVYKKQCDLRVIQSWAASVSRTWNLQQVENIWQRLLFQYMCVINIYTHTDIIMIYNICVCIYVIYTYICMYTYIFMYI
jgi:hypothetical protein